MSDVGGIDNDLALEVDEELGEPIGIPSLRDQIRAEREAIAQETTLDLIVPGYEQVGVRYRAIPDRELDQFAKSLSKSKAGMRTAYDLLIRCCETILVRPDADSPLEPLEDEAGDMVKYDQRLTEFLGLDASSAREAVVELFSPGGAQTLAPFEHANAVMSWMQGKSAEIDPGLLGE